MFLTNGDAALSVARSALAVANRQLARHREQARAQMQAFRAALAAAEADHENLGKRLQNVEGAVRSITD